MKDINLEVTGRSSTQNTMTRPITAGPELSHLGGSDIPVGALWYAGYTAARHEKRIAEHLAQRGFEYFLPLYQAIHTWKNGRHRVQLPLFPGYIFVRMRLQDWRQVLEVPGFVRLVGLGRQPCPLPETDIIKMREALSAGLLAEPYPYLNVGTRVEIRNGPLQGITGILLRRGNSHRLVISIELIMRSMVVEVDASDVVSVRRHASHRPDVYVRGSSATSRWRAGGSATICSPDASAQVSDEPPDPSHL